MECQNSLFRHFQTSSGIFKNIQWCWVILRYINAYWGIFRHYWGIWSSNKTYLALWVILVYTNVPTMSYLEAEASSKACQTCKMIMHIQSPDHSQNNLFKHFQRYLGIFRDMMHIQPLSKTHNYGEQKRPALPFLKSKKMSWFWKERLWMGPS